MDLNCLENISVPLNCRSTPCHCLCTLERGCSAGSCTLVHCHTNFLSPIPKPIPKFAYLIILPRVPIHPLTRLCFSPKQNVLLSKRLWRRKASKCTDEAFAWHTPKNYSLQIIQCILEKNMLNQLLTTSPAFRIFLWATPLGMHSRSSNCPRVAEWS